MDSDFVLDEFCKWSMVKINWAGRGSPRRPPLPRARARSPGSCCHARPHSSPRVYCCLRGRTGTWLLDTFSRKGHRPLRCLCGFCGKPTRVLRRKKYWEANVRMFLMVESQSLTFRRENRNTVRWCFVSVHCKVVRLWRWASSAFRRAGGLSSWGTLIWTVSWPWRGCWARSPIGGCRPQPPGGAV